MISNTMAIKIPNKRKVHNIAWFSQNDLRQLFKGFLFDAIMNAVKIAHWVVISTTDFHHPIPLSVSPCWVPSLLAWKNHTYMYVPGYSCEDRYEWCGREDKPEMSGYRRDGW